jgi:hypothetical protein
MRFETNEKVKDGFYSALVGAVLVAAFLLAQNSFARSWDFDQGPAAAIVTSIQGNVQTFVKTKDPVDGCKVDKLAHMLTGYLNSLIVVTEGSTGPTKGEVRKLPPAELACLKQATQKLMDAPGNLKDFTDALDGIDQVFALGIRESQKQTKKI